MIRWLCNMFRRSCSVSSEPSPPVDEGPYRTPGNNGRTIEIPEVCQICLGRKYTVVSEMAIQTCSCVISKVFISTPYIGKMTITTGNGGDGGPGVTAGNGGNITIITKKDLKDL